MSEKISKKFLNDMARDLGIKHASKAKKEELIHAIQVAEGHSPCFGRIPDCTVSPCLFRADCIGN
jgi:Rho termination factor, N-terminal domain